MLRPLCSIVALGALFGAQALAQSAKTAPPPDARPAAVVNLNTATVSELEVLPGIGARTAARIVEYREKKGPFKKIEENLKLFGVCGAFWRVLTRSPSGSWSRPSLEVAETLQKSLNVSTLVGAVVGALGHPDGENRPLAACSE